LQVLVWLHQHYDSTGQLTHRTHMLYETEGVLRDCLTMDDTTSTASSNLVKDYKRLSVNSPPLHASNDSMSNTSSGR